MPATSRWIVAAVLGLPLLCEATARYVFGLGDPPLIQIDDKIEYLFKPSMHYRRFGNEVAYNSHSMRSPEVPETKTSGQRRILVIGDSVINGGALTDQRQLATELLARTLGSGAWVGNISAGSWGPANYLAYFRKYGYFSADIAVLVISTHDLVDLPEFRSSYGADSPVSRPAFAVVEFVERYLPRYLPVLTARGHGQPLRTYTSAESVELGRRAIAELLSELSHNVPRVLVILHPTMDELRTPASPERLQIRRIVEEAGVGGLDLLDFSLLTPPDYRDDIHLSVAGQATYAGLMACLIRRHAVTKEGALACSRAG